LNYTDHAREVSLPLPQEPTLFIKANSAISGPDDPIVRPAGAVKLDYEVELAAVIGRPARSVDEARALRHVTAYCLLNDVSERAFQMEHGGGTTKGKSADTFAPIGPWLVTADEVPDPQALTLWTTVNGERRHHGTTKDMVFPVARLVAYVSRFMTLLPGDLLSRRGGPRGAAAALSGARRHRRAGDRRPRAAAPPGDPAPGVILIEHATVVTVDPGRRIYADGSVLTDGNRILQVGPAAEVRPPREPDRFIDGRRLVVTPGFVDTHVHLSEHLNRGLLLDDIPVDRYLPDWLIPLYAAMTAEDEQHAALLAGIEMIRTGTTTFCEAGTLFDTTAVAEAVERLGMRAILGRWTWDLQSGPDRMRQSTAEALAANEAMLAELNGRGGLVRGWPLLLGFGTCSEALIRGAKALADRHG